MAVGGQWEQVLGGFFLIHVPPESGVDPREAIAALTASRETSG
jgi:hypothetical protein